MDHILAGIADITHALKHPSPKSPLAPLTDSQSTALCKLMEVLHGTVPTPPTKAPHLQPAPTAPAPLLRVEPPVTTMAHTPNLPEPILILPDNGDHAALRVEPSPPLVPGPTIISPEDDNVTMPQSNCTQCTPPLPAQCSQLA